MRQRTVPNLLPRLASPGAATWPVRLWPVERGIPVLAVLLLALVIRLPFFLTADFPLNDGGLFLIMAQEVAAAGYALPSATTYNGDAIPFAYPPLPFYVTALLAQVLGLPALVVMRYLPLVANLLTVVAFVALARQVLGTHRGGFFAGAAFVVLPRSYEWLVMGGGLTRSLGLLFAVAALALAVPLYRRPSAKRLAAASVLVALTVLSHMEMGLFVAYSYGLFFLGYGRTRRGLCASALLALAVLGLTAPWWLTVVRYHGLSPYLAASTTAGWSALDHAADALADFLFPREEPFFTLVGGLAVLGALARALRGEGWLAGWLPLIFVLTPRSAATEGTVPLALLIGAGVAEVILPGLAHGARRHRAGWARLLAATPLAPLRRLERRALAITAAGTILFGYAVLPYWLPAHFGAPALEALPEAERQSMAWVADHTPAASIFLVLSPKQSWEADYVLEWFPALARRKSVLTPQGAEWLPAWTHARRVCLYHKFRAEALGNLATLEAWLWRMNVPYTHVYVSKATPGPIDLEGLREELVASPRYTVLLDDAGATVLARVEPAPTLLPQPSEPAIAIDCQTLFDQPRRVQAAFFEAHGDRAPAIWVEAHNRELARRRPW